MFKNTKEPNATGRWNPGRSTTTLLWNGEGEVCVHVCAGTRKRMQVATETKDLWLPLRRGMVRLACAGVHECKRECEWPPKPRMCDYHFVVKWWGGEVHVCMCTDVKDSTSGRQNPGFVIISSWCFARFCLSVCLSVCFFVYMCPFASVWISVRLWVPLSVRLLRFFSSVGLFDKPFVYLLTWLTASQSHGLSWHDRYHVLSKACFHCPHNHTDCSRPHCVAADGVPRAIMTVNRQMPGPQIR